MIKQLILGVPYVQTKPCKIQVEPNLLIISSTKSCYHSRPPNWTPTDSTLVVISHDLMIVKS